MRIQKFAGLFTASVTPFNRDRTFDTGAMDNLIRYYEANELTGAFVCSSSGEYYSMTEKDRILATAVSKKAANKLIILSQISDDRPDRAIERAKAMADAGADAVVAQPPRFFNFTQDELGDFFETTADGSPIPLIPYNHLVRLNNKLQIPLYQRLMKHENIIGVKDTHNDAERMVHIASDVPDMMIYAGGDSQAANAVLNGAYLINALSALAPKLMANLYRAGKRGDSDTTFRLQDRVNALAKIFSMIPCSEPSNSAFVYSLKAVLHAKGLCGMQLAQLGFNVSEDVLRRIADYAEPYCE